MLTHTARAAASGGTASGCRFTTYRDRFARAAPAPRAKNRGRASPVNASGGCAAFGAAARAEGLWLLVRVIARNN